MVVNDDGCADIHFVCFVVVVSVIVVVVTIGDVTTVVVVLIFVAVLILVHSHSFFSTPETPKPPAQKNPLSNS